MLVSSPEIEPTTFSTRGVEAISMSYQDDNLKGYVNYSIIEYQWTSFKILQFPIQMIRLIKLCVCSRHNYCL